MAYVSPVKVETAMYKGQSTIFEPPVAVDFSTSPAVLLAIKPDPGYNVVPGFSSLTTIFNGPSSPPIIMFTVSVFAYVLSASFLVADTILGINSKKAGLINLQIGVSVSRCLTVVSAVRYTASAGRYVLKGNTLLTYGVPLIIVAGLIVVCALVDMINTSTP